MTPEDEDSYSECWELTEEKFRCEDCGFVGPAYAKLERDTQGDGVMTGTVITETGDYECAECRSENVFETLDEGSDG